MTGKKDFSPAMAMLMASAMSRMAARAGHGIEAIITPTAEQVTTAALSPAQLEEMQRAPRAARRRALKELKKMKL